VQRRILVGLGATVVMAGAATAIGVVTAQHAGAALSTAWYASAPYLMPFENNPPDPITVMKATGQKTFQLAFILAPNGGGCTPTWDGTRGVADDQQASALIDRIRSNGGDVSVSIGGFGGTKLGQTCASPEATAAAYQQVVTKYGLKAMDFDLEEPEYENAKAVHNELGAAQILQKRNPGLFVSITTAATMDGTGFFGKQLLQDAKGLQFTPDNFSIMPFDGGFNGADAQINALEKFHGILMSTFGWDSETAYAHEGASLMNGRSDAAEMFPQSAFQSVLEYATSHRLARFTFWSVNRDRPCADPNQATTSGVCSTVKQAPWEFTRFTAEFAGARPAKPLAARPVPKQPPARPAPKRSSPANSAPADPAGSAPVPQDPAGSAPAPGDPAASAAPSADPATGCATAPAWKADSVFTGGMVAVRDGHLWKAKWWTQGELPGRAEVWVDQGACGGD
jgi:chitinase